MSLPHPEAADVTVKLNYDCGYGKQGAVITLPARSAFRMLRRGEGEVVTKRPEPEARTVKKTAKKKTKVS